MIRAENGVNKVIAAAEEPPAVVQEILIHADGTVEIPWITPRATPLVLKIWEEAGDGPFPVGVCSQSPRIYCG